MKVYLAWKEVIHEHTRLLGVYASEEKARRAIREDAEEWAEHEGYHVKAQKDGSIVGWFGTFGEDHVWWVEDTTVVD